MGGRKTLSLNRGEWLRNPQTLKGEGGCETLNPKRTEWLRNPHTLKGMGGCETPNPEGGCETLIEHTKTVKP